MADDEFTPLILNLESAAPMRVVYRAIKDGYTDITDIITETKLSDHHVREGRDGLAASGLVESRKEPLSTNPLVDLPNVSEITRFQLSGLQGLSKQYNQDRNWGKQAGLLLHYEYLIRNSEHYFRDDDEGLWRKIVQWERDNRGYTPKRESGDLYKFNTKKWTHWTVFSNFFGLIRKVSGSFYTLYPDTDLIRGTLIWYREQENEKTFAISDYTEWLHRMVIPCPKPDGIVPIHISQPLHRLAREGWLDFVRESDASSAQLAGVQDSQLSNRANSIKLTKL